MLQESAGLGFPDAFGQRFVMICRSNRLVAVTSARKYLL